MPDYSAYLVLSDEALCKRNIVVSEEPFRVHKGELYSMYLHDSKDDGHSRSRFAIAMNGVRGACCASKFGGICLDLIGTPWEKLSKRLVAEAKACMPYHRDYQWNSGIKHLGFIGEVLCVEPGKDKDGNKVCDIGHMELKNKRLNVIVALDGVWVDPSAKTIKLRWKYIKVEVHDAYL